MNEEHDGIGANVELAHALPGKRKRMSEGETGEGEKEEKEEQPAAKKPRVDDKTEFITREEFTATMAKLKAELDVVVTRIRENELRIWGIPK